MADTTRRFTIAGAIFVLVALFCFFCNAVLRAQEVTDVPVSSLSSSASAKDKVVDAIEGIKSGDISAAKEAVVFDKLLSYTLIRISDCWTLCKQEMLLAKECARQETIRTAKDIFQKGKDAAVEQTREVILENLPIVSTSGKDSLLDDSSSAAAPGSVSASDPNKPETIRKSIQDQLSMPISSGSDPAKTRESVRNRIQGN